MNWSALYQLAVACVACSLAACHGAEDGSTVSNVTSTTSVAEGTADEPPPLLELPPLPEERPSAVASFPFLPGEPTDQAISIGDTTHGLVVQGRAVRESESLKILPKQRARDLRYGTTSLTALLEHAGRAVLAETKTPLWLGNLGRKDGGDIEWSVSHNAGRDADVAFAYVDAVTKRPVDPPDLVPLDRDGLSVDKKLAFDAGRTWIAVRAMLQFEGASVQYLFISEPLKKKLLEHAKRRGEPARLLEHAADVLRQPAGAAPHDDHLHVRIYCGKLDVACGCKDFGFVHTRARQYPEEAELARRAALALLEAESAERRAVALLRLGFIGTGDDVAAAAKLVADPSPEVRRAAVLLLGVLGDRSLVDLLVRRFREENDVGVLLASLEALGQLGGDTAGAVLRDVMLAAQSGPRATDPPPRPLLGLPPLALEPTPLQKLLTPPAPTPPTLDRRGLADLAVRAARTVESDLVLPPLVAELDPLDREASLRAAEALAFVTNQRLLGGDDAAAIARAKQAYAAFEPTVGKHGKAWSARDAWVLQGFARRGLRVTGLDRRGVWELFRGLSEEPHVAHNARAALVRVLGADRAVLRFGYGDACRTLWDVAWDRRRELDLGAPSKEQVRACAEARAAER
jgi:penicillin-insensitive murein endopeptidase